MVEIALRDTVDVRGRYYRSVQLARDWSDQQDIDHYILTPTGRELATRIVSALTTPGNPRAWSVTGPYGSGKSAFALFLVDLLARRKPLHSEAQALRRQLCQRAKAYLPVLVVGKRAPLTTSLLAKLADSVAPFAPDLASEINAALSPNNVDGAQVAQLFEQAATSARAAGFGGLLVAVDEFGKHLEYAATHPESEDLLLMQHLAETANRSQVPILLITILHTAFAEYIRSADQSRQAEWQKVQGRFVDVAFLEPPEQLLGLIRAAIERRMPPYMETAYTDAVVAVVASSAFDEARQRFPVLELLPACAPLDPVTTLLLWPLFRSKLAQHERSLFGFLTSPEPFGFQEFLTSVGWDADTDEKPPFYRIDRLYDYVSNALGAAVYRGDRSRRWAEVEHALSKIGADAPLMAKPVIKAIGLLGLYGPTVGLRASAETLSAALGDKIEVEAAVTYLEAISSIIYRRHEGAYSQWEGSDVDLDACYEEGKQHTGQASPATRLSQMVTLTPVVARAHYLETGTLRYFAKTIIDGSQLGEALRAATGGRGQITYVLARTTQERESLLSQATEYTMLAEGEQQLQIFAFPRPIVGLEEALEELEAWRWVSENTPALQGDPVARQEVRARIQYAQQRLEGIAGRALGLRGYPFDPAATEWVQGGLIHVPPTAQAFVRWLSDICSRVYSQAPQLHNELLNRDSLSSSATAARRNLLAAMLTHSTEHRLGIQGTPAEVSMYEALLSAGGFHRERLGEWAFGEPFEPWQPVWSAITRFLETTHTGRRPVTELYAELKRSPFGLRDGALPVLLVTALLSYKDEIALYEGGGFVPELRIEALERLTRLPATFEIQHYTLNAQDREVYGAIGSAVGDMTAIPLSATADNGDPPLLRLVKPLVVFATRLPTYSKLTRRLGPEAIAVRDALLQARDPYKLLFSDLPSGLNINPEDPAATARITEALTSTLHALQRAYPDLLDRIEEQVRVTFGLYGTYEEARDQLQARATFLLGYVADKALLTFVRDASRTDERDWRESLGRVVLCGSPPAQWRDHDAAGFQVRLQQLRNDFVRVEELVAEQRKAPGTQILRIGLLNGHVQEAREVVSLSPDTVDLVGDLAGQVSALLEGPGEQGETGERARRLRLAVLAQVAAKYLIVEPEHDIETETPYDR